MKHKQHHISWTTLYVKFVLSPCASITAWQWCFLLFNSTYCLLKHGIQLLSKRQPSGYRGSWEHGYKSQHGDFSDFIGFLWDPILQVTLFVYLNLQHLFPNDAVSMGWRIVVYVCDTKPNVHAETHWCYYIT